MSNSANIPALGNKIVVDIPALNALLRQMIQAELANVTDLPARAKQMVEGPDGWEFQQFNGSAWATMTDWNINAQQVDGHSASTGTTPNTIPVRDADGKLPGDISGTAENAKKAKELSEVNSIEMGGTGGTTVAQARQNLGVAPISHASSGTDYGIGTESQYGHTKPHDAPDATLTAALGHAFSPAGAKVLEGLIGDLADVVSGNATTQAAKDAEQDAAINNKLGKSGGTMTGRLDVRSDIRMQNMDYVRGKATGNNYSTFSFLDAEGTRVGYLELAHYADGASRIGIAAVNGNGVSQAITMRVNLDGSIQATSAGCEAFLARGTVFAYAGANVLPGTLLCNGAAVSRTTYAALFAVIGTKYGAGDGTSTFNLPNLIDRFIQYSATAGTIIDAGLPNITGSAGVMSRSDNHFPFDDMVGAFYGNGVACQGMTSGFSTTKFGDSSRLLLDASKSNSVYGKSSTVQPPSLTMLPLIKY